MARAIERPIVGIAINPNGTQFAFVTNIPLPDGVSEEALTNADDSGSSSGGGSGSGDGGSGNGNNDNGGNDSGGNGSGGNNGGASPPTSTGCGVAAMASFTMILMGLGGLKYDRRRRYNHSSI